MAGHYLSQEDFEDFKINQNKLIQILNHNMTKMSVDVGWIKSWMKWSMGIFSTLMTALIGVNI